MDAKEKSEYLIETYLYSISSYYSDAENEIAMDCALIFVDEMLKSAGNTTPQYRYEYLKYWTEVKQHLLAL